MTATASAAQASYGGWAFLLGLSAQHNTKVGVGSNGHFLILCRHTEGETAGSGKWPPTANHCLSSAVWVFLQMLLIWLSFCSALHDPANTNN